MGQYIALCVSLTARNYDFLISAFPFHSTSFFVFPLLNYRNNTQGSYKHARIFTHTKRCARAHTDGHSDGVSSDLGQWHGRQLDVLVVISTIEFLLFPSTANIFILQSSFVESVVVVGVVAVKDK